MTNSSPTPTHSVEITIQRRTGERWPVVLEAVAGAELPIRQTGELVLDRDALAAARPGDYGVLLGQAVFQGALRDAFKQALARTDGPLHVLLFVEADELRVLHWQRLAAPLDGGWTALALHQRTPFALHQPSAVDRRFAAIRRQDLRALILAANPRTPESWGLAAFAVPAAVDCAKTSLAPIPADILAAVDGAAGPPTLDALCTALTRQRYALLHIVAHGRYKPSDREPILFLATSTGDVAPVPAATLIERLGKLRGGLPHLVFLSTCESADPAAEGVLGGLAQRLVRELGIPAVLAMTDEITVASALALATEFYQRLQQHGLPDLALAESYAGLAARPDVRVPVPALFTRWTGRPLFSEHAPAKKLPARRTLLAAGLAATSLATAVAVFAWPTPPGLLLCPDTAGRDPPLLGMQVRLAGGDLVALSPGCTYFTADGHVPDIATAMQSIATTPAAEQAPLMEALQLRRVDVPAAALRRPLQLDFAVAWDGVTFLACPPAEPCDGDLCVLPVCDPTTTTPTPNSATGTADLVVQVTIDPAKQPGRTSLPSLIAIESGKDPRVGAEEEVVATLRELFPLFAIQRADEATAPFRLEVRFVSADAAVEHMGLELRLVELRGDTAVERATLTLELGPAALRTTTRPVLAAARTVLTARQTDLITTLLRKIPLARVPAGPDAVRCDLDGPAGCAVWELDTGLRVDQLLTAAGATRPSLHERYMFTLEWGERRVTALRFLFCGRSEREVAGPILGDKLLQSVKCRNDQLPAVAAQPDERPDGSGLLYLDGVQR